MKITYHCSGHSYAVLLLENGTDIYTVAKMLGHKDMKSTLIYLKFTDELKLKAMNSLPNFNFQLLLSNTSVKIGLIMDSFRNNS